MQQRAKTRIGVVALTVIYSLLALPLTAHASAGVGSNWTAAGGVAQFGSSGVCYETGEGETWANYTAQDDHGFYAVKDHYFMQLPTASGVSDGYLNLCGELSRQPSEDPVLRAVGAPCQSGGELFGFQNATGSNGYGRITYGYYSGALKGHYHQLSDVRMVFTPGGSMMFKGEYTSSPGMPNASTGTAVIFMQMGTLGTNDCLLYGGAVNWAWVPNGSFALIPDVA